MNPNILCVIIFGSYARKDNIGVSDLDICVVTKEDSDVDKISLSDISNLLNIANSSSIEIATYSHKHFNSMLKYGSLFMWHLKKEGQIVFGEKYFTKNIKLLAPYHHHREEIKYHKEIFKDLYRSYEFLDIVNEYDLSILFTICRNTCMILTSKFREPNFGKFSCYKEAKSIFKAISIDLNTYKYLSEWKYIYERNSSSSLELPSSSYYIEILNNVESLINFALEKIPQNDTQN